MAHINLLKLCVGVDSVEDLERLQRQRRDAGEATRHVTRMWPKQAEALVDGGSLYWVIKGVVQARQRILDLDAVERGDGVVRCGIVLEPRIVRTEAAPRRPFQGWRYLRPEDAPRDLSPGRTGGDLPPALAAALADIGVR